MDVNVNGLKVRGSNLILRPARANSLVHRVQDVVLKIVTVTQEARVKRLSKIAGAGIEPTYDGYEPSKITVPPTRNALSENRTLILRETVGDHNH